MFRKLLNVGKGHSSIDKLQQQQHSNQQQSSFSSSNNQQTHSNLQISQQQLRAQFEYSEIKSYGFSQQSCLGYSSSLSLLAVGSKHGLVRIFGGPSVEFNYQLECLNSVRQLEFIDCRIAEKPTNNNISNKIKNGKNKQQKADNSGSESQLTGADPKVPAKLVALTDNGQLHLFELKTINQQDFADNQTQTEITDSCCLNKSLQQNSINVGADNKAIEYSSLEFVGSVDYFRCNLDDDDRSKRVSTIELSIDGATVYVGTEGGNVYLIPITEFNQAQDDKDQVQETTPTINKTKSSSSLTANEKAANLGSEHAPSSKPIENDYTKEEDTEISLNVEQQVTNIDNINLDEEQEGNENETVAKKDIFNVIKFDDNISQYLNDDIKHKKPGAIESIKRHPSSINKLLLSFHRGLSVIYDLGSNKLDKYFYHNQVIESSCFADQISGDFFYTSHNDGSHIKWDTRQGSQCKANEDSVNLLYGPYPCKPTPKISACTGLMNDQLEDLVIFSGGLEKRNDDDKNRVTIVRADGEGKQEAVKIVFDFTSKVLDFVVINRPRGNLSAVSATGANNNNKSNSNGTGGGGKKNKNKQQNQQHQQQTRNAPIAIALAILAEEEFVVVDLHNPKGSAQFLEFPLPYLNCIHSSAITCSQLYTNIGDTLYERLQVFYKTQLKGKLSQNEWPISGGKVIEQIESKSHDVLLTGHEDGSINIWDISNLSMRHLQHIPTSRFFSTNEDELNTSNTSGATATTTHDGTNKNNNHSATTTNNNNGNSNNNSSNETQDAGSWPPLKKVGRFDPYSDDARLAIRGLTICRQTGALVAAGTGGQIVVLELNEEPREVNFVEPKEVTIVSDKRFVWKGHEKLPARVGRHMEIAGYQLSSSVQLVPPVAATALEYRSDWHLFALGTQYGFMLYDLTSNEAILSKSTLNPADFAIISGDAPGTMSRKKSFRKSLRESFRRLRLGRSMRAPAANQHQQDTASNLNRTVGRQAFSRPTTGVRTLSPVAATGSIPIASSSTGPSPVPSDHHHHARNAIFSGERQVEVKVELGSIIRCVSMTWAQMGPANSPLKPSLWVGTNAGQVLIYAITLPELTTSVANEYSSNSEQQQNNQSSSETTTNPSDSSESQAKRQVADVKLAREIQLKHKAPIVSIFVTPNEDPNEPLSVTSDGHQQLEKSTSFESSTSSAATGGGASMVGASAASSPQHEVNANANTERELATQSPTPGAIKQQQQQPQQQARVLICTEEQFKVFNLPNLKPYCKFKLTANEGLRARKVAISYFKKPLLLKSSGLSDSKLKSSKSLNSFATQTSRPTTPAGDKQHQQQQENNNSPNQLNNNHASSQHQQQTKQDLMAAKFGAKTTTTTNTLNAHQANLSSCQEQSTLHSQIYSPYLVCMSNQGDCAIYSTTDLKRLAQVQVCKREDVNGIQSTMLTQSGEGYYLKSTSNFLRFSLTNQRVPRVLAQIQ